MRTHRAALVCLTMLAACGGDDGAPADDYEGTWLITSITVPEDGGPITLTRDGAGLAMRGDLVFAPTGDRAATLHLRGITLDSGVPVQEVASSDTTVAVEEGRLVVTDAGEVTVFTAALSDADHLRLTLDATDPRTTADKPPLEIVATRVAPWTTTSVGGWDLRWMTLPMGTMAADVCTQVTGGWVRPELTVDLDEHLVFHRWMRLTGFTDDQCTVPIGMTVQTTTGLAEEEGGNVLRLWGLADGVGERIDFSIARSGDQLTLTRTACLPMPACASSAPSTVVVGLR